MGMETEHKFCIIVGGGMCGIAVGAFLVKKKILPFDDFRLLDKLDDYGGVWQANHYPGAACDVVSHCYAMKFHLNPSNNTVDFRGLIRQNGLENTLLAKRSRSITTRWPIIMDFLDQLRSILQSSQLLGMRKSCCGRY